MKIVKFQLPPQHEPEPADSSKEQAVLSAILDQLESGADPTSAVLSTPGVTEWVAWQLGVGIEHFHRQQRLEIALQCGIAAIVAADQGGWPERSAANRNSLAGVMFQIGRTDIARHLCEDALHIAGPHRHTAYACSRSILGHIAMVEHSPLEAVCHYDALFRILKRMTEGEAMRRFAETALTAYKAANDVAGTAWCLAVIEGEDKARAAWNEVLSRWGAQITTENAISIVTRLNAFGLNSIAAEIEERFKRSHQQKENEQ
jgi:hypothetical protein